MDALLDHVEALARELPPNAKRQLEVLRYIATHPGETSIQVQEGSGAFSNPFGGRPSPLQRLAQRGLVYSLGRSNRHAWYVALPPEADRPAGAYLPGHP